MAGLVRHQALARRIAPSGWAECRRQLEYKVTWSGKHVRVIGRLAPASRMCGCGYYYYYHHHLTVVDRTGTCPDCGRPMFGICWRRTIPNASPWRRTRQGGNRSVGPGDTLLWTNGKHPKKQWYDEAGSPIREDRESPGSVHSRNGISREKDVKVYSD